MMTPGRFRAYTVLVAMGALLASSAPLPAQAAAATVSVDPTRTTGTLPADVLGLSYEADRLTTVPGFDPSQGNIAALLSNLGSSHVRIGAGAVDYFVYWNPSGGPLPSWAKTSLKPADLVRLAQLSAATGWKVELGVNLGHEDPTLIADEAKSAATAFAGQPGSQLADMECGNEPNGYGGRVRPAGYGYTQYVPDFLACVNAIGSNAPVAGPNTNGGAFEPAFANGQHSHVNLLTD